jgi:hypothetical protein
MPRDLAGLAGLGALGYMLANRNKGNPDNVQDTDMLPSGPGQQQYVPTRTQQDSMPDTEFGDLQGAMDAAKSRAVMDQFNQNEAATKPRARKAASDSDMRTMEYRVKDKAESDAIKKAITGADSGVYPNESMRGVKPGPSKPSASSSKETYRDLSGNVKTKMSQADRDAEMAARRESVMSGIKSLGSSIGDMASKARQNYESTRPVSRQVQRERDQAMARGNLKGGGKVTKMAKGGVTRSSASSRGDGIATKGHTKGRYL